MAISEVKPFEWQTIHTKPEDVSKSGGGTVVNPDGVLNDTDHYWLWLHPKVQFVYLRLKYGRTLTGLTGPDVQAFGKTADGLNRKLNDPQGNHELSIPVDDAKDLDDGTNFQYSNVITIQTERVPRMMVAIKTAFVATGDKTTSTIEAFCVI